MNCCDCPWKNASAIEYEIFEADGLCGIDPQRGTDNSSGIDVFIPKGFEKMYQNVGDKCMIYANESILIPLNLRVKIPRGFDIEVKNKSGVATKMKLIKGAQLIDQDYRGNVMIHLINLGETKQLRDCLKIAQLVVRPVLINEWKKVDSIDTDTERGEGGFGSTGDKA